MTSLTKQGTIKVELQKPLVVYEVILKVLLTSSWREAMAAQMIYNSDLMHLKTIVLSIPKPATRRTNGFCETYPKSWPSFFLFRVFEKVASWGTAPAKQK